MGFRTGRPSGWLALQLLLLLCPTVRWAGSATLSAPNQNANAGEAVALSVMLSSGGQSVSGVQFDLAWDPALDIHVAEGSGGTSATKVLFARFVQPRILRCLVVGMNTNSVSDGELLRLFVSISAGATPGTTQVQLANLSATTPGGDSISMQGGSFSVQIGSGGATQFVPASGILNAASLGSGPVSPGEIITVFGSLWTAAPVVLFNGVAAPILYAGTNQVNAIVPFGLDLSGPAQLQFQQGSSTATITVPVAPAAPAVFTQTATGAGPGAILNQDYTPNGSTSPAAPGSVIMVYGTGFGVLNPSPADGQLEPTLATTVSAVMATIGGIPAEVLYAGAAPGLIAGVMQINVRVPPQSAANPAAPLSLTQGPFTTPSGVTVAIR